MHLPLKYIATGVALGVLVSVGFATAGPGPVLDVIPDTRIVPTGFDTSRLVKFEGQDYRVDHDDTVSADALSSSVIKKIEAGKVSYVNVATTSSGTYSSDGLVSRHVQYPGVTVTPVSVSNEPIATWSRGVWVPLNTLKSNSIVQLANRDVKLISDGRNTCVATKTLNIC